MARPITYDPELALERAMELFWRRGYGAVSVDDVVRATGLNRHSLYARYGNKYGLLQASLQRYGDQAVGTIRSILEGPGTPAERIGALMKLRHPDQPDDFWQHMMSRGCMGLRTAAELSDKHPELIERARGFQRMLVEWLADVVREGQQAGEFRTDRPAAELAEVIAGGFMASLVLAPSETRIRAFLAMLV